MVRKFPEFSRFSLIFFKKVPFSRFSLSCTNPDDVTACFSKNCGGKSSSLIYCLMETKCATRGQYEMSVATFNAKSH